MWSCVVLKTTSQAIERDALLQEVVRLKELAAESDASRRAAETSSTRLEQRLQSIEDEKLELVARLEANIELVARIQKQRTDESKVIQMF